MNGEHQTPARLRLIHFGDLHLWRAALGRDFYPKRFLGLANLIVRRGRRYPRSVAEALVRRLMTEEADYVLFSGDLTTTSHPEEFRVGRKLLAPLLARWGERFIAIPGNHDRYTPKAVQARYFERLFLEDEQRYPFARDLSAQWALVAFDCSLPHLVSSHGVYSAAIHADVKRLVQERRATGREVIVMGHYPLAYPGVRRRPVWSALDQHGLRGSARAAELFETGGARLYLHGHEHRVWSVPLGAGARSLNCGSCGQKLRGPGKGASYLRITLEDRGVAAVDVVRPAAATDYRRASADDWTVETLGAEG